MNVSRSNMWKEIWNRKASDIKYSDRMANGWEKTTINGENVVNNIEKTLNLKSSDRILEIGCGAGYLSNYFIQKKYCYTGIDYSENMIKTCKKKYRSNFYVGNALNLDFKDDSFDFTIIYSVLHYLDNIEDAFKAIEESLRVSRKGIFIGDLPETSHSKYHLLFNKKNFNKDFNFTQGYYNSNRFNIYYLESQRQ